MSAVIERIGLAGYRVLGMEKQPEVEITAEPEKRPCGCSFVEHLPGIMPYRRTSEPLRQSIYKRHQDGIPASSLAA